MSDESALLKAILAAPDDDTVRLVYADWLEEHGQPERAEYIRIECEMTGIHDELGFGPNEWESPRFWELDKRREELYDRHAKNWFAPLFKVHRGDLYTRRGFPYHVALTARKFIDDGTELIKAAPTIEDVFIGRLGQNMPELARTPALQNIRKLTFYNTSLRTVEAEQLASSPYLGNLRELDLGDINTTIGPRGAYAIARAKSLKQLRKLDIGNHAISDDGARQLIHAKCLATLTDISMWNNDLTDSTLFSLSQASHLKLTSLDLMDNFLSGSGLAALDGKHLSSLEYLSVSANSIGHDGAVNLARIPFAENLRNLFAGECAMDDKALAVLLSAEWPQLTELNLWDNGFGSHAAKALAANRSPTKLEELSLARCEIGPTAARALGRASLPVLQSLDADNTTLGPKGIRALLAGPLVSTLRTLHLDEAELGDDGAVALAKSPAVANLRWLRLSENHITNRGAVALAESPYLEAVQSLDLSANKIKKKGREALVKRFGKRVDVGD